jgi:hypothetical protein
MQASALTHGIGASQTRVSIRGGSTGSMWHGAGPGSSPSFMGLHVWSARLAPQFVLFTGTRILFRIALVNLLLSRVSEKPNLEESCKPQRSTRVAQAYREVRVAETQVPRSIWIA